MTSLSVPALRCGGPSFLPYSTKLQAGPLSLLLENGELRRIRWGDHEVIRRIYTSLRGPDWGPIPALLSEQKIEAGPDSFTASFALVHRHAKFDFTWTVTIQGTAEGTLSFYAHGKAATAFSTNRASICVLHPLRECVGQPVRFSSNDGAEQLAHFPESIEPNPLFSGLQKFAHEIEPGLWAELTYTGEFFEMEDQRNWSDGSFKTYSPPQNRPKPRQIEAGWETVQSVTLKLNRTSARAADRPVEPTASIETNDDSATVLLRPILGNSMPIPAWGFGTASHGHSLTAEDVVRLKILAPSHLRANFRLSHPSYLEEIIRTVADARLLGVALEIALFLPEVEFNSPLAEFAQAWRQSGGEVIRWILFSEKQTVLSNETLETIRKVLEPLGNGASFAIGSREDFVLLNRARPESMAGFELTYGLTPQIHLYDNRTLVEALEGQAWTLRTVKALWPNCKAVLSPIALKRSPLTLALRRGSPSIQMADWHSQIDPRQFSLFGATWTLASLKAITLCAPLAGLSATYFETTGLLGLISGEKLPVETLTVPGSDLRLDPGWVYPLFHVFADFAEFRGGQAIGLESSLPKRIDGLMLSRGNRLTILVVNLEERAGRIRLQFNGSIKGLRRLNEKNAMQAIRTPEVYRALPFESIETQNGILEMELMPFELVRIDLGD
jgi:D-apionolactonase